MKKNTSVDYLILQLLEVAVTVKVKKMTKNKKKKMWGELQKGL